MTGTWYNFIAFLAGLTISLAATSCTPDEIAAENLKKLAKANNYLALNLLRELSVDGNVFISPLSLSTAFGMLYYGTRGDTAQELRNTLGYEYSELPEELVHQAFQKYLTETLPSQDASSYVLSSANSILLDKNLDADSSYMRQVQDLYQASVKDVDFSSKGQQIVQEVNAWVKDKTSGKIDKLLEDLDPSTILVLLNAVYFKGTWKTQFEQSETQQQTFYRNGLESGAAEVSMMKLTEIFPYTKIDGVQAVELPYKGENVSMVILLPDARNGLEALEKSLSLEKLSGIRNQLDKTKIHLSLPKFKVEYSREMSGDFQSLGASSIFKPGADFSGITSSGNVYVSQVLHKAVIEVNEEGSEAAAVTGIISNRMRPIFVDTPEFVVDHPFLFAIVDKRNDMILFLGRVSDL